MGYINNYYYPMGNNDYNDVYIYIIREYKNPLPYHPAIVSGPL